MHTAASHGAFAFGADGFARGSRCHAMGIKDAGPHFGHNIHRIAALFRKSRDQSLVVLIPFISAEFQKYLFLCGKI